MKLSLKFFCAAYTLVLFSVGVAGVLMQNHNSNALWRMQRQQAELEVRYLVDCFEAMLMIDFLNLEQQRVEQAVQSLTQNSNMADVVLYTQATVPSLAFQLEKGQGVSRFVQQQNQIFLESIYKVEDSGQGWYLAMYCDFTPLRQQANSFWVNYRFVAIGVSLMSGLLLFALTRQIVKPLNQVLKITDEIAGGSYGKKVRVKTSDQEIANLASSINLMSQAVEQTVDQLKEEAEKRKLFVADFTHELKTPMTAILGYAQMLDAYPLEEQERKQAAQAIYRESKRLEQLSLQLLDLYALQNSTAALEPLEVSQLAEQLEVTLRQLSQKYQVDFEVNFQQAVVMGNEVLLLSLLYNLADNAFKASAPGGRILLYTRMQQHEVQVFVQDWGRGIQPENLNFITEPFFREDKARSRQHGEAGLGLALCKEIAALHGTQLCFESQPGRGTRVCFMLAKKGEQP